MKSIKWPEKRNEEFLYRMKENLTLLERAYSDEKEGKLGKYSISWKNE